MTKPVDSNIQNISDVTVRTSSNKKYYQMDEQQSVEGGVVDPEPI